MDMISQIPLTFSLISGIMASLLFVFGGFIEKDKKKSRWMLIWATLFLGTSFGGLEWAFWLEGYNMFELVFRFTFPLIAFFTIWSIFIVWLFERRKERKIWIILMIVLIIFVFIAVNCMNCLYFG